MDHHSTVLCSKAMHAKCKFDSGFFLYFVFTKKTTQTAWKLRGKRRGDYITQTHAEAIFVIIRVVK